MNNLKPAIRILPPRIGYLPGDEKAREATRSDREPWRLWFNLARWKALRLRVFKRDRFTCQNCGKIDGNTSRLVGDHREPHHGDPVLFWDEKNIQTLCKKCHDGDKQRQEIREGRGFR